MLSPLRSIRKAAALGAFSAAAVLLSGSGQAIHAQQPLHSGDVQVLQVRPNVYMLVGAGSNIAVHVGWMGALVVDTGSADASGQVLAAIKRITDKPIRFITNTTADDDHVGGNEALARSGQNLLRRSGNFGGGARNGVDLSNDGAAGIMGHENVLRRMSAPTGQKGPFAVVGWPTEVYSGARNVSLYLNGDGVQMMYQPAAHSDADSFVYFRRADVIAAGDILDLRHFPIIDVENGGTITGLLAALTRLIELSVPPAPFVWHDDRTLIIPGHGRLSDQGDVVEYRDMLTIIRDRIHELMKKGMTLEQVRKANPTHGYDRQYGRATGPWTTDMFVSAVYRTLGGK